MSLDCSVSPKEPSAPPAVMRDRRDHTTLLFAAVFAASLTYVVWRLFATLPLQYGVLAMVAGGLLWFCESAAVAEAFTHFNNARKAKAPELPAIGRDQYPEVDVLVVTHNESEALLYKTLNGCNHLQYPDPTKVHVYLCDDANRPEMAALARRMGVGYLGFDGNEHAKAGNLNFALPRTESPLVAVFDADMIPASRFLLETVPYFLSSEMIKDGDVWRRRTADDEPDSERPLGYVQTQQAFYNPDVLQRNLYLEDRVPNEQDYFYRSVNVARMHTGSAAFAGSNSLFSRQALVDAGGFAAHSITEDFATSVEILGHGYRSIAVDKELAHGLAPEDAWSFIKQRQRWGRGAAQVVVDRRFWRSGMPLRAKWNFLVSYFYWWTFVRRLVFILAPILCAVFGVYVADVTLGELLAVWLPYYVIYNVGLRHMSGRTTNALWSSTVDTIQFPYLIAPIILGTLGVPDRKFFVTPKDRATGRNSRLRLALPHMVFAVLTAAAVAISGYRVVVEHSSGSVIVLFWALYNLLGLCCAILYYRGRILDETHDEVDIAPLEVTVIDGVRTHPATVAAMGESRLALVCDEDELPVGAEVGLNLSFKDYNAQFRAYVDRQYRTGETCRADLTISTIGERDRRGYLQILHDRDHRFPRTVRFDTATVLHVLLSGLGIRRHPGEDEPRSSAVATSPKPVVALAESR